MSSEPEQVLKSPPNGEEELRTEGTTVPGDADSDQEAVGTAGADAAPARSARGTPGEAPGPRPISAASSYSDESGSETDFTAVSPRHRHAAAAAAAKVRQPEQAAPAPPSEAEVAASPFIDLEHPVTLYEGVKLVLMAPVVLLKLVLLACVIPYAWAVLVVLLLGHKPQTPMHPFRQFLVRQWVHQWGRFVLFVAGFYYIPVRGWSNMRAAEECRAILVFNHPSYVDAAVISTVFTPSGVSKAGVANMPFIGLFGVALQLFFVERKGSEDQANRHVLRGDAVDAIAQRAADRRFPLVAIAPEATTKSKPCLLKFRRGAFSAGQPVCPVLLRYRYRHFNPGWGVCNTPFHFYRLMAQFVNHLDITILPPYHPSDEEARDWVVYAESVRRLMGSHLGVPLVDEGLAEERQLWRTGAGVNLLGARVVLPKGKAKGE